jgi:hypothetical protein
MVEVAAHMVDNVFPRLPVRQWVLSFPKRLRYFLQRDAELTGRVLQVFLRAVEAKLRAASPDTPADARFGGVTFVQRPSRTSGHASARHSTLTCTSTVA